MSSQSSESSSIEVEETYTQDKDSVGAQPKNEAEIYRLAGRPPLKTILILMIGPIFSQVSGALYGIINSIWVSKAIGELGLSALATEMTLEGIGRSFGYFLMVAASTKISQLFGQGKQDEASQVICDLLRFSIICGAIVPAIIIPSHQSLCEWFGASEETTKLGFDYILPLAAFAVFTCINLSCQGFLQAEGRTLLIGFIDLGALAVACGGICPFLLYVVKSGINAASISTVCVDAIPGIILTILYFKGVFGIKPKLSQLLKPFSKHTYSALLVGLSQLISNLASYIPGIPIRNLIGLSCGDSYHYDLAMAGFNVICRYAQILAAVIIAITTGFIAPASYAHAAGDNMRYLKLSFHAGWLAFAWSILTTIFSFAIPREISMIFGSGEEYLSYATPMLRNGNALGFIRWVQFNSQAMLQAFQLGGRAMIVSTLSNFVSNIGFAYLLYYTNKHDVIRLMWVYPCSLAFGFVVGIVFLAPPLYKVYKKAKLAKQTNKDSEHSSLSEIRKHSDEEDLSSHDEADNIKEV